HIEAPHLDGSLFQIDGVMNFQKDDGAIRFFFKGDINTMLDIISQQDVADVTIEEPTLEEIFMHYYE
ncbi:MAG: hypothetical protein PVG63_06545, partial [Anaerolineales bacterium]